MATPWTNTNDSCRNETRSCQDDAFWYITRTYERSCWELEQNKNEFLFSPPHPRIFRITYEYLLHSLIFPHSLRILKDFGTQITNTAVFAKIYIFQKWVLFPIWFVNIFVDLLCNINQCLFCGQWSCYCDRHIDFHLINDYFLSTLLVKLRLLFPIFLMGLELQVNLMGLQVN